MPKPKLLIIADSPTLETGFARVIKSIAARFAEAFELDFWGIGYNGWPHSIPYRIFPTTGGAGEHWTNSIPTLLRSIPMLKPDHVFILNDPWLFSAELMAKLKEACLKANPACKITFYCPVDSWLLPTDVLGLRLADNVVAYTNFGAAKLLEAGVEATHIIPHGVDSSVYRPLENREEVRARVFGGWLSPNDTLITYVGAHSRRKAWWSVMETFAKMLREIPGDATISPKLLMHMEAVDQGEATNAFTVAHQLGLTPDNVLLPEKWFRKGGMPLVTEAGLNEIYNSTDIFLTCTLGEGWGLPIVEALAAGVPMVFVPDHSACGEICTTLNGLGDDRIRKLPMSDNMIMLPGDNSRVRQQVDTTYAAELLLIAIDEHDHSLPRTGLNDLSKDWLSWDRVAKEFLNIMQK